MDDSVLQEVFGMTDKPFTVSVSQMREADAFTIRAGTPSKELMLRAAQGVLDAMNSLWRHRRTAVVCGSGNNGGDGYALAMLLAERGADADIVRLSERLTDDGAFYLEKCRQLGIGEHSLEHVRLSGYDIVVDCVLGTGFSGEPREPAAGAIRSINAAREESAYIISVDINSGMNGDTGEAVLAVKSDLTVSVGFLKTGMFLGRSGELIGRLVNADIGIRLP